MSCRIIFTPEAADLVSIIGVFYGGQDYETLLLENDSDDSGTEHESI